MLKTIREFSKKEVGYSGGQEKPHHGVNMAFALDFLSISFQRLTCVTYENVICIYRILSHIASAIHSVNELNCCSWLMLI